MGFARLGVLRDMDNRVVADRAPRFEAVLSKEMYQRTQVLCLDCVFCSVTGIIYKYTDEAILVRGNLSNGHGDT